MRPFFIYICGFIYLLLWASCSPYDKSTTTTQTDGLGRTLQVPIKPRRVISLCPSQTECLLKIIDSSQLVAVTTACDYPEHLIKNKVRINSYPPDYEKIVSLHPDLVLSLKGMIKPDEVRKLEELGIAVLVQKADSLKNIADNFRQLGNIFEEKNRGDSLAQIVETKLMKKKWRAEQASFLFLFSYEPLYAFGEGNFLNEIFENNGLGNKATLAKFKVPYPIVSREYISLNPPDYLFVSNAAIISGLKEKYPELRALKALDIDRVIFIDADVCSRPTLRLLQIDSLLKSKFGEQ